MISLMTKAIFLGRPSGWVLGQRRRQSAIAPTGLVWSRWSNAEAWDSRDYDPPAGLVPRIYGFVLPLSDSLTRDAINRAAAPCELIEKKVEVCDTDVQYVTSQLREFPRSMAGCIATAISDGLMTHQQEREYACW
jgi:hypothetical protein